MSKKLVFPDGFKWGTSTAAAQIETASDHNWKGITAKDGSVFQRTSDHEKRREEDVAHICRFGSIYRCGLDWARLQTGPKAEFDTLVVEEYKRFFSQLNTRGMEIMLVLHHFAHPKWLEDKGGWSKEGVIPAYIDFAQRCIYHFGRHVKYWNTFNEPNVFALNGYILGVFPPFKKNYILANKVLSNMGRAHDIAYELIQESFPDASIGISLNTGYFKGLNFLGKLPAIFSDWWFHRKAARYFEKVDFWGLSYYAYVPFDPLPVTEIDRPGQLAKKGLLHDKMWAYYPQGLGLNISNFWKRYKKPIFITENGICTDDPEKRIQAIKDYLSVCHEAIEEGIPVSAYIFCSTFDNFEWHLGKSYRFGLIHIDWDSMERRSTTAADFYETVCKNNELDL